MAMMTTVLPDNGVICDYNIKLLNWRHMLSIIGISSILIFVLLKTRTDAASRGLPYEIELRSTVTNLECKNHHIPKTFKPTQFHILNNPPPPEQTPHSHFDEPPSPALPGESGPPSGPPSGPSSKYAKVRPVSNVELSMCRT